MSKKVTKVTKVTDTKADTAALAAAQAAADAKAAAEKAAQDKLNQADKDKAGDGPKTPDPTKNALDKSADGNGPEQQENAAPKTVRRPAQADSTVIADAEFSDADEAPVNISIDLPAGTENPPLHMLNQHAWANDKARRDADPLSGLERVIGQRNARKLMRRLPEGEAKAEFVRQQRDAKRHRVG